MTYLEIDFGSGDRRTVELDKRQPVSIGRHPSNDVTIAGDDVELMHCRISWQKSGGYQVVAAGKDGVDVNGTLVQKSKLATDDVLRIGPANITFRDPAASPPETADFEARDVPQSTFSLKPLSGEIDFPLPPAAEELPPLTADEIIADDPVQTADEIITGEPIEEEPRRRKKKPQSKRSEGRGKSDRAHRQAKPDSQRDRKPADERDSGGADEQTGQRRLSRATPAAREDRESEAETAAEQTPVAAPLRERFRPRPQRPGDRDPARSPFVLTLGGGALALLLIAATFYFMLGRQTTQSEFDAAQALMDEGKYAQAITAFEDFLALHPRDSLADVAEVQRWICRIERQASGASPDWSKALVELNGLINARRDVEGFEELHDVVRNRAEAIAEGAATTAGKTNNRDLLAVSDEAGNLLTIYAPQGTPPTDALKRIEAARRVSEAAILKHEAFMGAVAEIDMALKNKQTMAALDTRRRLLARYPEFTSDATVAAKLRETLRAERELVTQHDEGVDALTDDRELVFPRPLSLTFHARSRTDEVSEGRSVFGVAKDCCYAVDSITGEPIWQRVIGWDTPFFPVPVAVQGAALLVFDTNHDELLLLDQRTGGLLWRQPATAGLTGTPLVEEGQAYVVDHAGALSKVDLETGRLISRLRFSQPVSPPEALNDKTRLVVGGEQEVLYTLTKRPLECVAVSHLGHKPKSIASPLLAMGALLLVPENLPEEQAALHVLNCRSENDGLAEIAKRLIPGHVVDNSVIRGRDLFVPSSGERISSFTVSDEEGQPPLTDGPRYEAEGTQTGPVFLATGPDRQVWMAGRQLRKLQLTADAIEPGQQLINLGAAVQPLQQLGKRIYVGRTLPFSTAVTLFQADRDQL
ncbi:MAG: PQQ-binding-like beta-propeller repeat protein, partial [Planctomycetaceae bacterium]